MTRETLKRNSELALKAPPDTPVPSNVWLPPSIRDKDVRISQDVAVTRDAPSVQENMVRISTEADPIGLLIAIANGQPISTFAINADGEVETAFETLPLKDRLKVIFHLADKVLPRMQVTKKSGPEEGDAEWETTLTNAAER